MKAISHISLVFILLIQSCGNSNDWEKPKVVTNEIEGNYYFKYPSGEIELINMNLDKTFLQTIYKNELDYKNNAVPLYENKGTWTASANRIDFLDWLEYCYMAASPDSVLVNHKIVDKIGVYWIAPTKKNLGQLNFYSEEGYIFEKIDK